jgi:group I intron endonuclease
MGFIYILTSPSGKSYVGQTRKELSKRLRQHCKSNSRCSALVNAIKKYGGVYRDGEIENFDLDFFEVPDDELDRYEVLCIECLETLAPGGYNLTTGGEGGSPSDETRAKISKAHVGRQFSDETRAKMSEAQAGKKLSEEHRAKISKAGTGKKHSPETLEKISKASAGRKHSDETLAKISKASTGRKHSDETRAKISEAGTGRKHSDETRAKLSKVLTGRKHSDEARANMRDAWRKRCKLELS